MNTSQQRRMSTFSNMGVQSFRSLICGKPVFTSRIQPIFDCSYMDYLSDNAISLGNNLGATEDGSMPMEGIRTPFILFNGDKSLHGRIVFNFLKTR